jgi:hypothetical protein
VPLKPPPPNLGGITLATRTVSASSLYRVSRHTSGEPFFGDGLLYMSRHLNDRQAVVVFSRAASKLGKATYAPLMSARSIHAVIGELHVAFDA